jgi:N-methylhydantoinase A
MALDMAACTSALESVAAPLGLSAADTAAGIHELVNQNMAAASRMHAVEQGADLRGITVIAFGGAGPVHACGVAELLESPRVVFPVNASVLSAFGTLVTPVRIDLARSMVRSLATHRPRRTRRTARRAPRGGSPRARRRRCRPRGDPVPLRHGRSLSGAGQRDHHLGRRGQRRPLAGTTDAEVTEAFESDYRRIYGLTIPDVGVEAVTWRLSAYAPAASVEPTAVVGTEAGAPIRTRPVRFSRGADPIDTPVYRRVDLGLGQHVDGPAIVEERETTAVIRPGWTASVLADGSLLAERAGAASQEGAAR